LVAMPRVVGVGGFAGHLERDEQGGGAMPEVVWVWRSGRPRRIGSIGGPVPGLGLGLLV
jgi:hypothetical protein